MSDRRLSGADPRGPDRRERRKMGRPPVPEEERLSVVLSFKVTSEEADALYKRALREGVNATQLLRKHFQGLLSVNRKSNLTSTRVG